MSEWDKLSEWEQDFINHVRKKRGICPDDDTLMAYHGQTVPADRAEKIETHIRLCGTCQIAMKMLKRFDECVAGNPPEPSDWPEVQQRGRDQFAAFLERQKASSPERPSFWDKLKVVVLHPAFAYLLLAMLVYPAYRGIVQKPETVTQVVKEREIVKVPQPVGAMMGTTARVRLESTDSRGEATKGPVVDLRERDSFLALDFFVPIRVSPDVRYDAEIRDDEENLVIETQDIRSRDALGRFSLVCNREPFQSGQYTLSVKEVQRESGVVTRVYTFRFRLR